MKKNYLLLLFVFCASVVSAQNWEPLFTAFQWEEPEWLEEAEW